MDNITYYSTVKLLHIIGMSAWFGTAIVVSVIWSKKDGIDLNLILDLITKVEMPASFFIPLTGVLMTIDQTYWLNIGWIATLFFDKKYKFTRRYLPKYLS